MTSEKQIKANRENGKKGGVKTAAGKEVSKMNSLRHGILAHEAVIRRGRYSEDFDQYDSMRQELVDHFQPKGALESMLVDQLFSVFWRQRRVIRAERAIIEKAMSDVRIKQDIANAQKAINYDALPIQEEVERLNQYRTSLIYKELIRDVQQIVYFIEKGSVPLPEILRNRIKVNFGVMHQLSPYREKLLACDEALRTKEYHDESEVFYQEQILIAANELLNLVVKRAVDFTLQEEDIDESEQETIILPSEQDVLRIQRYESHLYRQFFQILHELQRVQSVRLGKPAPLAAALDVTVNNENGFVS